MPQLWLTYDELAEELGCEAAEARDTVIRRAWTRKHSRDGLTRVLMPFDVMQSYFLTHAIARPVCGSPPPMSSSASATEQLRRLLSRPPATRAS